MATKKTRKAGKKTAAPPPPKAEEGDTTTAAPVSQSIESDVAPVIRHSIEADNEGQSSDIERPDE
jgi:hypothetical protein